MFCHECGKSECEIIEGLCKECFLKKISILTIPENIEITVCAHCNAKFEEGKWKDYYIPEEEIIYRGLEKAIEINPLVEEEEIELEILQMRGSIAECYIEAIAIVFGETITESHETNVKIKKTVCPNCSKMNSGYYESVIQLRADSKELTEKELTKADEILQKSLKSQFKKNKLAYLVQKARIKEGVDFYIGSYKAAKKIAEDLQNVFGGVIKESPRLISQDKSTSKGIYRVWISIRLPKFKKGDFIKYSDKLGQIKDITGKKIIAINLKDFNKFSINWRDYDLVEILKEKEDIKTSNIISKSPKIIQLLDPDTYEVLEIAIDQSFKDLAIGKEINFIEVEEAIYLLPRGIINS